MTADRERGFTVVEVRAVHARLPLICSRPHIDKCSLETRWTRTVPPGRSNG